MYFMYDVRDHNRATASVISFIIFVANQLLYHLYTEIGSISSYSLNSRSCSKVMAAHNITPTVHNTRVHINTATPPIQHSLASF